jgi:hypothetical protein
LWDWLVDIRCVKLAPGWGKAYTRKGAALVGLGQGGEAVKVYLEGLKVDPASEALKQGLGQAREAINQAKQRYDEMWGEAQSAQPSSTPEAPEEPPAASPLKKPSEQSPTSRCVPKEQQPQQQPQQPPRREAGGGGREEAEGAEAQLARGKEDLGPPVRLARRTLS